MAAACIFCMRSPSAPENRSQMRTCVRPPAVASVAQPAAAPRATAPAPTRALRRRVRRLISGPGPVSKVIVDLRWEWCNVAF